VIRSHSLGVPHRVEFTNGETTAVADVPKLKGGAGCGFGPHELLEAALATCLTISVEMCAAEHGIPLESAEAEVRLDRSLSSEVHLIYSLTFRGAITQEQRNLLKVAASQCPVQRTLTGKITCRDSTGRE
jgi:putative redox protein